MKNTFKGLLKLTRFYKYACFVVVATILGIASAKGQFGWRFLVVLAANWLAVGFAFMVHFIENAPDDALSPESTHQNPISTGWISPKTARTWTFATAILSTLLFALLGWIPLLLGLMTLILGFLYSAKAVRLRSIAFFNILAQSLLLAGLPFLTGYFSFQSHFNREWYWPFIFVVAIVMYTELRYKPFLMRANEHPDANTPEGKTNQSLILIILLIGLLSGFMTFVMLDLIPLWVVLVMLVLAALFLLPLITRPQQAEDNHPASQTSLVIPLVRAAAIALLLQYILPWLNQAVNIGIFK